MPIYFITPNYSLALIPKVGCSSISRAVIKAFQPQEENLIINAAYPDGGSPDNTRWQMLARTEKEPSKQVLAIIRDPVERFKSAIAQMHISDVDATIDSLINGTKILCGTNVQREVNLSKNGHFVPQIMWLNETSKLYKFPDHINDAALEVGLQTPIPTINRNSFPKPNLTQAQIDQILQIYAEDVALYNSITSPGIITGAVSINRPQKLETPPVEE